MAYKTIIGTMKTAGTLDISAGDIDLAAGSVDNADLAGSIANSKLVNDSVTVTAGNGLSGGGEVDLGASVSVALDLNELSAAAVAVGADSIAIIDADDNSSKKESIADLVTAMAGDGLAASSGVLAVGVDDSSIELNSDALRVKAAGITDAMLNDDVATGLAGNGLEASSGVMAIKLESNAGLAISGDKLQITGSAFSAGVVAPAADELIFIDADGSVKREAFADYAQGLAGNGLAASAGALALDLSELSDAGALDAANDLFAVVDASDSDATKAGSIVKLAEAMAGVGLAHSSGVFALDLNEISGETMDVANDKIPFVDATDGGTHVESVADLMALVAGNGLEAASGVLAVKLESNAGLAIDGDKLQFTGSAVAAGAPTLNKDGMVFLTEAGVVKQESFADYATAIAGDGLAASAGVLAVGVDDSSIELDSDALRVKAAGVTNAMLAGSIANAKLANSAITIGSTSTSLGGTSTAFSGLTGLDFTAANASIAASLGANTLTIGGAASHVRIAGNLEVVGSVDAVSTTELRVEDLTIQCASGSANSSAADGAGLKVDGADASFLWSHSGQQMVVNEDTKLNGMTAALASISADTTLTQKHFLVKVDTSGGAVTVTLPSSMPTGKVFVIKQAGHASNAVTIATAGSETIDGAASVSLSSAYGAANLMFDGSNYLIW